MRPQLAEVEFWWTDLKQFLAKKKKVKDWRTAFIGGDDGNGMFRYYLTDFLTKKEGGEKKSMFLFEGELVCGEPAPRISVTYLRTFAKDIS